MSFPPSASLALPLQKLLLREKKGERKVERIGGREEDGEIAILEEKLYPFPPRFFLAVP